MQLELSPPKLSLSKSKWFTIQPLSFAYPASVPTRASLAWHLSRWAKRNIVTLKGRDACITNPDDEPKPKDESSGQLSDESEERFKRIDESLERTGKTIARAKMMMQGEQIYFTRKKPGAYDRHMTILAAMLKYKSQKTAKCGRRPKSIRMMATLPSSPTLGVFRAHPKKF